VERSDAGRNPDEGKESVDRPHSSTSASSRKKIGKNLRGGPIQYSGIVESGSEVGKNAHERERTAYQENSANPNYRMVAHCLNCPVTR
jgi:hypothetical protein